MNIPTPTRKLHLRLQGAGVVECGDVQKWRLHDDFLIVSNKVGDRIYANYYNVRSINSFCTWEEPNE